MYDPRRAGWNSELLYPPNFEEVLEQPFTKNGLTKEVIDAAGGDPTARAAILRGRNLNAVAVLGDSRAAAVYISTIGPLMGSLSPFNWANAYLGQRMTIVAALGVSGQRTDQIATRLEQAIASEAGILYIHAGVNDIGQQYPTNTTSGATAATNLIMMVNQARNAGMLVVIEVEVGASNMTSEQIAQVQELNARLYAYASKAAGVVLHDARPVVMAIGTTTTLAWREGYAYDVAHPNTRGSQAWGKSLALTLGALVAPRPVLLPGLASDVITNGRWQLARNPFFQTTTGGTVAAGITGNLPQFWEARISNGATATLATNPNQSPLPGNGVTMTSSFTAARQSMSILNDIQSSNVTPGEQFEAVAEVTITDASALVGVYLLIEDYPGAAPTNAVASLRTPTPGAGQAGPLVDGTRLILRTPPIKIVPRKGSSYVSMIVRGESTGAGSGGFTVHRAAFNRLPS